MNNEELDFEASNPILLNHCVILEFQTRGACLRLWSYISQIWQVLSRLYLTPRNWVFAQFTQVDPKSEMDIVFLFLRYSGLRHHWNIATLLYLIVDME